MIDKLRFAFVASVGELMMRYGLSAAIIVGVFCLAPGGSVRTSGDYLPGSHEMTPPAGLHFEDDIYFHDGKTRGGKPHPDGRRVACNFMGLPWHCRPFEVALS